MNELPFYTYALISECALCYNTGLINKQGSPFKQLKEAHPELELPRSRKAALLKIKEALADYKLPDYFLNTVKKIENEE